jgi:Tfp pilus assembly protein PilX
MKHQQGSALIISLVILMVLTVLAVSAMSNAQLDEKISSATQFIGNAFQNTATEINREVHYFNYTDVTPLITAAGNNAVNQPFNTSHTLLGTPGTTTVSTITYLGEAPRPLGSSLDKFKRQRFELNIKTTTTGGSSSDQIQGIVFRSNK